MNKFTTILEKRKNLVELSRQAKALRDNENIDGSINYMLLNYLYDTNDANEFKTFAEWKAEGYSIRKGAKAFTAWGKPKEKKNENGEVTKFFPITYLFSNLQVYKKEDNEVKENISRYKNFIGEIKVSYIKRKESSYTSLQSPDKIAEVFRNLWNDDLEYRESFYLLALNNHCDVLGFAELFHGGICSTLVDNKVIFQLLLNVNATAFVIAHNHPSGSLEPSKEDRNLTQSIASCAKLFNISLLDHIILTGKSFYSFCDNGLL